VSCLPGIVLILDSLEIYNLEPESMFSLKPFGKHSQSSNTRAGLDHLLVPQGSSDVPISSKYFEPPEDVSGYINQPRQAEFPHLNRQLEEIVQTLSLRLRLMHRFSPNINPMPPNKNRICIRILVHRLL